VIRLRPLLLVPLLAAVLAVPAACGVVPGASPPPDAEEPEAEEPRAEEPPATEVELAPPDVPALHPSVDGYPEAWVIIRGPAAGPVTLAVKVADTPERRRHGLMEVPELPAGTGMLFAFEDERTGGFWMKDTLVPLDIAFAAADGTILAILPMDPCEQDPCEVYDAGVSYRSALEVPQGWFDEVGVEVGHGLTVHAGRG
jgi:uncharacterized protein